MRVEAKTFQEADAVAINRSLKKRGNMFLRMKQLPGVDNLGNYPTEIIEELKELLLLGGLAFPDPKRKDFYDLENLERTFFIHISPKTGRVGLLATWLRAAIEFTECPEDRWIHHREGECHEQN